MLRTGVLARTVMVISMVAVVVAHQHYCRCECNGNKRIDPIDNCGLCTKDFCLTNDDKLCEVPAMLKGDGDATDAAAEQTQGDASKPEENVFISCYKIESFKDQIVIYSFILVVFVLFAYGTLFKKS